MDILIDKQGERETNREKGYKGSMRRRESSSQKATYFIRYEKDRNDITKRSGYNDREWERLTRREGEREQ